MWISGHNVAGYLPDTDTPSSPGTWEEARAELCYVLDWMSSDEEDDARHTELDAAHRALHDAPPDVPFLRYTSTHADSAHDKPTAWWIVPATEEG